METNKILVVGGAGYIGSHTVYELLKSGYEPIVFDSFITSSDKNLTTISNLTGKQIHIIKGDIKDSDLLKNILKSEKVNSIIHFAAFKNAGESVKNPSKYFSNNVVGMLSLLEVMRSENIQNIVFSSSASVYGNTKELPITESTQFNPMSPYGESKMIGEIMLRDFFKAYGLNSISLRYFNVAGADESGILGEEVSSTGNVIPLIMENLCGRRNEFSLFGNKFSTKDGTQERDYIHVTDLAKGHIKALEKLAEGPICASYNLGTGSSTSNLELINLSEEISGRKLNYTVVDPRIGDPEIVFADPSLAQDQLGWKSERDIKQIIIDAWKWHSSQN